MVALRSRFAWMGAGAVLSVGAAVLVSQVRGAPTKAAAPRGGGGRSRGRQAHQAVE